MTTLVRSSIFGLVACLVMPASAQETAPASQATSRPACPPTVDLALLSEVSIKAEECVGGDDFFLTAAPDGSVWLVLTASQRLAYTVHRTGAWSDFAPIPAPEWKFINRITAAVDKGGKPVAIWTGFDGTPGEALAVSHWTGSAWSDPKVLDRLETATSVAHLRSLRDPNGIVHVAYDRPLVPRESYSIGGHGMFPSKCWHAFFDGEKWSKPRPTMQKGEFGGNALGLSIGPDGHLVLAVHISPPGSSGYIGEQVWDGKDWTKPEKYKDGAFGGLIGTPWGDRLVWWTGDQSIGAALVRDNRETDIPWSYAGDEGPPMINDSSGRIVVCLQDQQGGFVQVWNGVRWSKSLKCGVAAKLVATTNGELLAARWQEKAIRVQTLLVREVSGAPTASQPEVNFAEPKSSRPPDLPSAVKARDTSRVREILARNPSLVLDRDYYGLTPLMYATKNADMAMVELLLKAGAESDRSDFMDNRPLHIAAQKGSLEICALLVAHGAAINSEDKAGKTALAYADASGNEKLVEFLKEHGGTRKDFHAQIVKAVEKGDRDTVTRLLDDGISVNTAVPNGHCLLDYAAESGDIEMAKLLIARGAKVTRADSYGRTALYWASYEGKPLMVAFLIAQGADPNAREWKGETPLHAAVSAAQSHPDDALETIKKLVAGGAQVNAKDDSGATPLARRKRYGTDAIRAYLRDNGGTE